VEAFYFAAGLRVVGAAVAKADAAGMQGDFEGDSAGAAVAAGEDSPVVAEQAGWIAIGANGFAEAGVDVAGLEHRCPGIGDLAWAAIWEASQGDPSGGV